MLIIATPIAAPNSYSAAGFPISITPSGYAPAAVISNPHPIDTLTPTTPPPIVSGIITVTPPPDVRIRTLVIGGITYTYTLVSPPPAGQFTEINGQLQIGYLGLVPPIAIGYYLAPINIPTDVLLAPYPEICTRFPLTGELSWTLTWEEQPTASFKFITLASERSSLIDYFRAANRIDIYGVGFCPSGQLSITEISLTKSAIPLIEVSINLTGWHSHFLDKYISIGGDNLYNNSCSETPIGRIGYASTMTLQDIAQIAGTQITGSSISIDPSVLDSPAVPTTLGSQLDNASIRGVGAFLDWNTPHSIVIKPYNQVAHHQIDPTNIRSDIQSSINNQIGLSQSLYKTYDPLTKVTFGSKPTTPNTSVPAPEWQPKKPEITKVKEGDPDPTIDPYVGTQKDLSIVFDISGQRKRQKETTLINGQPSEERSQEWGYVAVGRDHMVFDGSTTPSVQQINGTWQLIESTTTNYTYNPQGYLISIASTGKKLVRYRTENAQKPESLAIAAGTTDPLDLAKLQTYRFFYLPISRTETYRLELLANYYDDIKAPKINRAICLPDGSEKVISEPDESYIPQYFVVEKLVVESGFSSIANPDSTTTDPLPNLTTGKKARFVERVQIGGRVVSNRTVTDTGKNSVYYIKSTDNYSAADGQFQNTLSIAQSEVISGRPPVAPSLGAFLELAKVVPPQSNSASQLNKSFGIKSGLIAERTGYLSVASLDFPSAGSQTQAMAAAQVDIDLINAKNTYQESFLTDFRPQMRPGDLVTYQVNGETRQRRLISASFSLKINGIGQVRPHVTTAGTQVKLGLDAHTPVILVNLPSDKK